MCFFFHAEKKKSKVSKSKDKTSKKSKDKTSKKTKKGTKNNKVSPKQKPVKKVAPRVRNGKKVNGKKNAFGGEYRCREVRALQDEQLCVACGFCAFRS